MVFPILYDGQPATLSPTDVSTSNSNTGALTLHFNVQNSKIPTSSFFSLRSKSIKLSAFPKCPHEFILTEMMHCEWLYLISIH